MEHYNVSRTVIREAIGTLSSKGLVKLRHRFRPVVVKPSIESALGTIDGIVQYLIPQPGGVRNLFNTRVLLEAALVREVAVQANMHHIKALRQALKLNHDAINDSQKFYATDVAFHAVLYTIPDNPVLPAIHKAYTSWLAKHWQQMQRLPERNRINYEAHKAIFEAILDRDPDTAEQALRHHLEAAWRDVKSTFNIEQ